MGMDVFITKYVAQLKALSPKYDTVYEVSAEHPVKFEDEDNIRLSMVCIADTHLINKEECSLNLENCFKDAKNSVKGFDAFLIAGDITEYGTKSEYRRFFNVLDKQTAFPYMFLTMGNHDVRFQYGRNQKIIMKKVNEYLKIDTKGKSFYSYEINGYKIIVIGTEKRVLEKAHITQEQIDFLDRELASATAEGKPAFVMCHQAFQNTHGLPEVWKTGDMGEQSDDVRAVMEKYRNVFFITGHLHGGVCDKVFEVLNEENNVVSLSVPGYRKENNFGNTACGIGYYVEVYDNRVIFKARNFLKGENVEGDYTRFEIPLK